MAGKLAPRSGAGRGTRGAGREGGGSEGGPASLAAARARARWSPHTHAQTRARARAHTPKKSSVTCSLSKPALAPGKTYPFLVSTPTSGSSSLRRHPYNIPTMFKKKSVHWVLYIYIYVFIPQSSSLVRPFCSHTSLALPLSAHHKPPTSAGSPGLEPLPFTRDESLQPGSQSPETLCAAPSPKHCLHLVPCAAGRSRLQSTSRTSKLFLAFPQASNHAHPGGGGGV